jgi:hypothetical protein
MFRVMEDAPTFMAAGAGAANLVEFRDETNTLVGSVEPDGTLTVTSLVVAGDSVSASTIAQSARDDYIRLSMEVL